MGKTLLPYFGGSASVWISCLAFFQIALLGGYLYAHWLSQRSFREQAMYHLVLLALSSVCLPPRLKAWPPVSEPSVSVFFTLLLSIGLPFFLLASHTPLLQAWKARTSLRGNPYRLAIPSNAACIVALLSFPLFLESRFPLSALRHAWSVGYGILGVLMFLTAGIFLYHPKNDPTGRAPVAEKPFRPTRLRYGSWLWLSAVPAALLSATTLYLSTQVAPIPLLWTLPLTIYLLTFVIAFSDVNVHVDGILRHSTLPLATLWASLCLSQGIPVKILVGLHLVCFFGITLRYHRALVLRRPHPGGLTFFYIAMALGGAIGGLLEAVVFPLVFRGFLEFPLLILVAVAWLRRFDVKPTTDHSRLLWDGAGATGFSMLMTALVARAGLESAWPLPVSAMTGVILGWSVFRTWPAGLGVLLGIPLFLFCQKNNPIDTVAEARRSFYGLHRIYLNPTRTIAWLSNGTTLHGGQWLIPKRRLLPVGYYDRSGPLGDIFNVWGAHQLHKRVGVVGLGTAGMLAYARDHDPWTYFELDPTVIRIATEGTFFTYTQETKAQLRIVPGDARLSLGGVADQSFDLLIIDAFGSDWIPSHLLTREALAMYLRKLAPGGLIVFHVSNQFLDLWPVVAGLAQDAQLTILRKQRIANAQDNAQGILGSRWVVMARRAEDVDPLIHAGWGHAPAGPLSRLWTDELSSVVGLFNW